MRKLYYLNQTSPCFVLLTNLLAALITSVVQKNGRVDEGAGGGHVLSQQAFHFVRTKTDREIQKFHRSNSNQSKPSMWELLFDHKMSSSIFITAHVFQV